MNEKIKIGEIVQTEPGNFLFAEKKISAVFKNDDGKEAEYLIERRDHSKFFEKISKPQDYLTWQLLKSHLSITTKIVHATQKEMAEKVKMRLATFSESLKRLQEKGMVRQYQSTVNCARGFVLINPAIQ